MTTHTDLALAQQNIMPTQFRSSRKYTDLTTISRRIFGLSPSIKYLKCIQTKSADIQLVDKLYYD